MLLLFNLTIWLYRRTGIKIMRGELFVRPSPYIEIY